MTDILSPAQTVEALAPWPDEDQATADLMARWFTAQGFASYCRLSGHPCWQVPDERDGAGKPAGAYAEGLRGFARDAELAWTRYVSAYLLRVEADLPVDMPLHEALRREEDAAEVASEMLGDWLAGYGIDAEAIVQAVHAERANVKAVAA